MSAMREAHDLFRKEAPMYWEAGAHLDAGVPSDFAQHCDLYCNCSPCATRRRITMQNDHKMATIGLIWLCVIAAYIGASVAVLHYLH